MPLTKQDFERYKGKQVKIVFKGNDKFFLNGVISEVNEGSFVFHTKQRESTIDQDLIAHISISNGGRG